MSGSIFGNNFKISTFGESHGKAVGVIVDGCPANIPLTEEIIQTDLNKRKPGTSKFTTPRKEDDTVEILSGVFEGKTTGTPIAMVVFNKDQRSRDYEDIKNNFRPGHADFAFEKKYGNRDYRGGGRSSGRETIGRVAGGAVAKLVLKELGIHIETFTYSVGHICVKDEDFDIREKDNNPLYMPNKKAFEKADEFLQDCIKNHDSAGGVIACNIYGVKAGIGEPVFNKLDALFAQAMFSIGGVKGFEIGSGFSASTSTGFINNDEMRYENGKLVKLTNNSGGISGGISDGGTISFKTYFKPTPSIYKTQKSFNTSLENVDINIQGRHDPIIVPRAIIVVEAMSALVLVDSIFSGLSNQISCIKNLYLM